MKGKRRKWYVIGLPEFTGAFYALKFFLTV